MEAGTIANRLETGFARKGGAFRQTTAPSAVKCAQMCKIAVASTLPVLSILIRTLLSFQVALLSTTDQATKLASF